MYDAKELKTETTMMEVVDKMEGLTKENILSAISEIEENGVRKGRHSNTYDILFEGKRYPPKLVVSIAFRYAYGKELNPTDFEGGKGTHSFSILEKMGFKIESKKSDLTELVDSYKEWIKKSKLNDERYKWELVAKFKGRPNVSAIDFSKEFEEVDFANLIYPMAKAVGNHLSTEKPAEFSLLFSDLFDEDRGLTERIKSFSQRSLELYRGIGEEQKHHQDERTISTYLTFYNPEKYTFYKNSFYQSFCKEIGVKSAPKNEKYVHYLELLDDFIEEYISPDSELIDLVKSYIPDYYDGSNHLLLAQDILYTMFDKPNVEVKEESPNQLITELIDQYREWLSIMRAHLSQESVEIYVGAAKQLLIENGLKLSHELISQNELEEIEKLCDSNDKIYSGLERTGIRTLSSFLREIKGRRYWGLGFGSGEYYTRLERFKEENFWQALDYDDWDQSSAAIKARKLFNNIKIGDFVLIKGYGGNHDLNIHYQGIVIGIDATVNKLFFYPIKKTVYSRKAPRGGGAGNWHNTIVEVKRSMDISELFPFGVKLNSGSEKLEFQKKNIQTMDPINKILFGPPGTGKTYRLKEKYFSEYITDETRISREQFFSQKVSDLTWWQVIAIALLEEGRTNVSGVLSNRWVMKKSELSNSNTVRPTIWGQLQSHTIEECEYVNVRVKQQPLIFTKNSNSEWEILETEVTEQCPELFDILESTNNFNPSPENTVKRYVFTTFHQSYGYEDFIEGIKPVMSNDETQGSISYRVENGVFKELCLRALNDPENRYAIFIDEINRGNIASIFGELITLIEIDKRSGGINALSAVLPYSKDAFSVPSNVDIIGTMNTADRSVEALDTALRRRFTFEEILPNPNLLTVEIEEIALKDLLQIMNERIEVLVDRDHTIGHAFFMGVSTLDELRLVFANKVIPLLQEYFYGDYGKMEMVIGHYFFKIKDVGSVKFAEKSDNFYPEGRVYHIKNISDKTVMDDNEFITALKNILNLVE